MFVVFYVCISVVYILTKWRFWEVYAIKIIGIQNRRYLITSNKIMLTSDLLTVPGRELNPKPVADPRDVPPPSRSNFFHFHAVFSKYFAKTRHHFSRMRTARYSTEKGRGGGSLVGRSLPRGDPGASEISFVGCNNIGSRSPLGSKP